MHDKTARVFAFLQLPPNGTLYVLVVCDAVKRSSPDLEGQLSLPGGGLTTADHNQAEKQLGCERDPAQLQRAYKIIGGEREFKEETGHPISLQDADMWHSGQTLVFFKDLRRYVFGDADLSTMSPEELKAHMDQYVTTGNARLKEQQRDEDVFLETAGSMFVPLRDLMEEATRPPRSPEDAARPLNLWSEFVDLLRDKKMITRWCEKRHASASASICECKKSSSTHTRWFTTKKTTASWRHQVPVSMPRSPGSCGARWRRSVAAS
jgi:hypothetical protein